ncbi:winged helix-turn-helix transcriptional regulator [Anaerolineae bacterium CFX9]|nr:MarR family winged helix-turn-helix transcriptional regulator [Oscillatoria laete-virens]MDL1902599.1 winged helix-turn-helix transcriptional regulator [Anaerolineae bacterium CFX9]MDL5055800.1 MarR family winged helix-turn-helix transcriptional regulator [Oscillatoria laete-virens NRMC-F 0139]
MNEPRSVSADAEQLYEMLYALVLDLEKHLAARLSAHGLTTPQFYVLKTLSEHQGRIGIGQLARLHGLTSATMTGLIHRLSAFDPPLVEREVNAADRRAVTVVLTEAGSARYGDVQRDLLDQLRVVFNLLPDDERKRLLDTLARYIPLIAASLR